MRKKSKNQTVAIFLTGCLNQSVYNSDVTKMNAIKSADSHNRLPVSTEWRYVFKNFQYVVLGANLGDTF